jgi:hypothetical protein
VTTEEGMEYAEKHSFAFIETSALDATGVSEAFRQVLSGASLSLPPFHSSPLPEIYKIMCRKKIAGERTHAGPLPSGSSLNLNPEDLSTVRVVEQKEAAGGGSCC